MIGLSLVAEGFGFHIPKGYLYAAIGFWIIIEVFNQIARRNFIRHQSVSAASAYCRCHPAFDGRETSGQCSARCR